MMGSAEALPEEPAVRPMFVEDMTEEQLASAVSKPQNYQPKNKYGDWCFVYRPCQLNMLTPCDVYQVDNVIY